MAGSSNLTERLRQGRQIHRESHKAGDAKKLGNLRAGNSGIMSAEGEQAGNCVRIAHLRAIGVELEVPEDPQLIMFQMGTVNEDVVFGDLQHTSLPGEIILRETEIPTSWRTTGGVLVTGRPDMVVCRAATADEQGARKLEPDVALRYGTEYVKPVWGIELKSVASVWTTREVLFGGNPKLPHLIQAGHYSMELDCTFKLTYKQYANQAVPAWAGKMFPRPGQPLSEHISYNESGEIKNVKPFEYVYELQFSEHGNLQYRPEAVDGWVAGPWVNTLISKEDIRRFYQFAGDIPESGHLGSKPLEIDATGKKKSTGPCSYCPLSKICRSAEKDEKKAVKLESKLTEEEQKDSRIIRYNEWLTKVKTHLTV